MSEHIVGLDLGKRRDYTAAAVLRKGYEEREPLPGTDYPQTVSTYKVGQLARTIQTSYEEVADKTANLVRRPELASPTLVVDETGVGVAVTDMLRSRGLTFTAVSITAGNKARQDPDTGTWYVPKRDLVSTVDILLQSRRLTVVESLAEAETLTRELQGFQYKLTAVGHDTYGAPDWREGSHDDLVLAVALACWFSEYESSQPQSMGIPLVMGADWGKPWSPDQSGDELEYNPRSKRFERR